MSSTPTETHAALATGDVIADRYVVERLIGRGGMGEVHEALDAKLERSVALKVVTAAGSAGAKRRLEAEAKAVASLAHPGIVHVYDVVEHRDALVLVMELVRGSSLRERLAEGPLAPSAVADVVSGVADALAAAHERGLVHRDVKPDNVLVRRDGRTALLDFGIAKAVTGAGADAFAATITGEGAIVGTPAYLAPEQVRGEGVSAATDQFALAVTAYELLTGSLPWDAASMPALIASIVSDAAPSVRPAFGAVGAEVDAVLKRALSKAAGERYDDIGAFSRALGEALQLLPPSAVGRARLQPAPLDRDTPALAARERETSAASAREAAATLDAAPNPLLARLRAARRRRVGLAMLSTVLVLAVAAWAGRGWLGRPGPQAAATTTALAIDAGAAPMTWRDLVVSGAGSEEDRADAREAARAYARGEGHAARRFVDAAILRNPAFAGAQLLRAYCSFILAVDLDERARAALRAASAHRDVLSPREAELLDALSPSFFDPPRWRESAELLEQFTRARPLDAQGWDALAFARAKLGDYVAAEKAFGAEMKVDPRAASPYTITAQILAARDEEEQGAKLLQECIRKEPSAIGCRVGLSRARAAMGECEEADRQGRDALSVSPESAAAFGSRAVATAGLGAPNDVVADLLAASRRGAPPERMVAQEALDAYLLATRVGDFPAALAALGSRSSSEARPNASDAGRLALARVKTLWEMGDRAKAADEADAYLQRTATRNIPERAWTDPIGPFLAVLRAAGRLTPQQHDERRRAWLSQWRARRTDAEWRAEVGRDAWAAAYDPIDPPTAESAAVALEAMRALGVEIQAVPDPNPDPIAEAPTAATGRIYLAAGRLEDAEKHLVIANRPCRVAPSQRARLALGDLYARRGDVARACAAYAVIEGAWGHAKPRSVTAEGARAGARRLKCTAAP